MTTVAIEQARRVAKGEWPEDGWQEIWVYHNAWGGTSFKLLRKGQILPASSYVIFPKRVWQLGDTPRDLEQNSLTWYKEYIDPQLKWAAPTSAPDGEA
jgi:hypothetical protein